MQNKTDDKQHNATSSSMGNDRSNEKNDSLKHGTQQGQHVQDHKESDKPFRKDSDQDRGSAKPDDRGQHPLGGRSGQGQPHK